MHPILFRIPFLDLPIYTYGFMLGIAFIVTWNVCLRLADRDGVDSEMVSSTITWALVGGLLGARVLYFVVNPDRMDSPLTFFKFNQGGLVVYGGYIGGTLSTLFSLRRHGFSWFRFADYAAPNLALGLAFGRIGCLMYGCDYGKVTDVAWAITFPAGSPAFVHHLDDGLLAVDAARSLPIHPTQLYATFYGLCLFSLLYWAHSWPKKFYGQIFLLWMVLYAPLRFTNELFRADRQRGGYGLLSTSQWIGLLSMVVACVLAYILARRGMPEEPAPSSNKPPRGNSGAKSKRKKKRKKRK